MRPVVTPDPLLRKLIALCREQLQGRPAQALDARLAAAGAEPDQVLAQRLAMTLNTFLQNFTRARRQLAECLQRRGVDSARELGLMATPEEEALIEARRRAPGARASDRRGGSRFPPAWWDLDDAARRAAYQAAPRKPRPGVRPGSRGPVHPRPRAVMARIRAG
jgi:hypothetical protein